MTIQPPRFHFVFRSRYVNDHLAQEKWVNLSNKMRETIILDIYRTPYNEVEENI